MDEIREFILTKTSEINEKLDKKLEVIPCNSTLTQVSFRTLWKMQFVGMLRNMPTLVVWILWYSLRNWPKHIFYISNRLYIFCKLRRILKSQNRPAFMQTDLKILLK